MPRQPFTANVAMPLMIQCLAYRHWRDSSLVLVLWLAWATGDVSYSAHPQDSRDLSALSAHGSLPLDVYHYHQWVGHHADSAVTAYEAYVSKNRLSEIMTNEELLHYKKRYMHFAHVGSKMSSAGASSHSWEAYLREMLVNQMPAILSLEVEQINSNSTLAWTAQVPSWALDFTLADAKTLMGYVADDSLTNATQTTIENAWVGSHVDADNSTRRLRDTSGFPPKVDIRQKWPECATVIGHVRDQGKCGSCWAQAAAGSMDGRLCLASSARFNGANAKISAGYITSCYNMKMMFMEHNGCEGGNPGWAFEQAKRSFFGGGVPTESCVPYFGSGDALKHFESSGRLQAPKCPSRCTSHYQRGIKQDLFFTVGSVSSTKDFYTATWLMYTGGTIAMSFKVMKDFMAYKGGFYKPVSNQPMGGHAVTMIGWDTYQNQRYVQCINSWGAAWGEHGLFKLMATCCGVAYYIPDISGAQSALPVPGGPTHSMLGAAASTNTGVQSTLSDPYAVVGTHLETDAGKTLRVVMELANVPCDALSLDQRAAISTTVANFVSERYFAYLTEVTDIEGIAGKVSILPCADNAANGTKGIVAKEATDYLKRLCGIRLQGGVTGPLFDKGTTSVAFLAIGVSDVINATSLLKSPGFRDTMTASIKGSLDSTGVSPIVISVCVTEPPVSESAREVKPKDSSYSFYALIFVAASCVVVVLIGLAVTIAFKRGQAPKQKKRSSKKTTDEKEQCENNIALQPIMPAEVKAAAIPTVQPVIPLLRGAVVPSAYPMMSSQNTQYYSQVSAVPTCSRQLPAYYRQDVRAPNV